MIVLAGCASGSAPAPPAGSAPPSGGVEASAPLAVGTASIWWPTEAPRDRWFPVSVLRLPDGALVLAETNGNRLFRLERAEATPERLQEPSRRTLEWTALAASSGLSFFALDGPGRVVHQYDLRGSYLGVAVDLNTVAAAEGLGDLDPAGLAVDRTGRAIVTDRLGDRLLVFGPGWSFNGVWGQSGSGPGSWRRPGAAAVDINPPFLVADEGNSRIVLVDGLGAVIAERALDEPPRGVAVLERGRYALTLSDRVEVLNAGLEPLWSYTLPKISDCPRRPFATAAVWGEKGRVVVGEGCSGRLLEVEGPGD